MIWLVLAISMAAALLPIFLVPNLPPLHSQRERSALTVALLLWTLAVAIMTIVILKRVVPVDPAAVSSPSPRMERPLKVVGVLLACLTLYEVVIVRRPIPLWLWFCCAAIVAVMTVIALRSLPRDQRHRLANTIYGMMVGLCVLFPVITMPRRFRGIASLLLTIVVMATLMLMIRAATRQRKAPVVEGPRGKG